MKIAFTLNEAIAWRVQQVMDAKSAIFDSKSGYCLRVMREIIAPAFNFSPNDAKAFYDAFLVYRAHEHQSDEESPWARDMQLSLRARGWQIPFELRQGGDICFSAELAFPIGHVGVLLAKDFMFENTSTTRGALVSGKNRLSHLSEQRHFDKLEIYRPQPLNE